ncbi:hypothetical protein PC129_g17865 [Phytophthora cactorum]|nr:hypothetical protein Pcac1_g1092 [Phytophthora cactorum]KAG2805983.1 hypothetical protein PC111_g17576 [Phytophthora cactorum]KAG2908395.1 hypothetical protein PC117_g19972 [Phytophthora cactorum]KAG2984520.1 hypothetical protein PC119_g20396 [Phytophthora cactorum]KAG3179288.1 hypothetical protein C6341_g7541 [Phytophthora cactorum]
MLARDKTVEIGTAKKMPTDRGTVMLEDVVATGALPLALVLQNNHFRAVVYDAQRFKTYQGQRESKIPLVNDVRLSYEAVALSTIQWEYEDIAKLASSSLKSI